MTNVGNKQKQALLTPEIVSVKTLSVALASFPNNIEHTKILPMWLSVKNIVRQKASPSSVIPSLRQPQIKSD